MSPLSRNWLATLTLLASSLTAAAAPAPPPSGGPVEKYLPDDTEAVAVLNVKQVVASPLFVKNYQKKLEGLLAAPAVAAWLKDSGIDPLHGIDRLTFFMARSVEPEKPIYGPGIGLLVQGRFDAAKVRKIMGQRAREMPKVVQVHEDGKAPVYEINHPSLNLSPLFIGLVDRGTLLVTSRKAALAVARDKAAGKKKTAFKYPALGRMLKDLKPGFSLGFVATRDAGFMTEFREEALPGGGTRRTVKRRTFGDDSVEGIVATATLAADFRFRAAVTTGNAGQAKAMAKGLSRRLRQQVESLKERAATQPGLAPAVKALEALRIRAAGVTLLFEAEGGKEVFEGLLQSTGIMRAFPDSSRR